MKGRIAILLHGPIYFDQRVIKTIRTLSEEVEIDLFYLNGVLGRDMMLFNSQVNLHTRTVKKTFIRKVLSHSLFCFEYNLFYNWVLEQGHTYTHVWCNDLPTLYPGFRLAQKIQAKLIYDAHEIYTETLNQFFPLKAVGWKALIFSKILTLMRWHGNRMERNIVERTQLFITVNSTICEYYKSRMKVKNSLILMNYPKRSVKQVEPFDFRKEFSWGSDDKILIYQGVLNEGRGLRLLIKSMKNVMNPAKLVIIGDGVLKAELISQVNNLNLDDRVKFIPMIPPNELLNYTAGADFGINLLEDLNLSKKWASPNKLFEYIQAELPVIASNSIENGLVFAKYEIGLITRNNQDDIVRAINQMVLSDITEYTKNCKIAKEVFIWENQEGKLKEAVI